MTSVISYLGNKKEYDISDKFSSDTIKKSLEYRRQMNLAEFRYNNIWNYQQRKLEGKPVEKELQVKEELGKCISLSKFDRKEKFIKFFKKMLVECEY